MTSRKLRIALAAVTIATITASVGCSPSFVAPPVNAENCNPQKIEAMPPTEERKKFATECLLRPVGLRTTPARVW